MFNVFCEHLSKYYFTVCVNDIEQWRKFQYIVLVFSREMVDKLVLDVPSMPTNLSRSRKWSISYCERAKKSASS